MNLIVYPNIRKTVVVEGNTSNVDFSQYVLRSESGQFYATYNPSGFITTGQTGSFGGGGQTGVLSGVFYPLSTNPSGYITTGQTGNFAANTGVLTGAFYPLRTNPSGYLISSSTGSLTDINYVGNVSGALSSRIASTGSNLLTLIQSASGGVPSINGISGALTLTGGGNVSVIITGKVFTISGNTGAYVNFYSNSNPSGFITTGQTGNFVATGSSRDIVCDSLHTNGLVGIVCSTDVSAHNYGVGAGNAVYWTTKSQITSPTNGTLLLTNAASNSFDRVIFGTNSTTGLSLRSSGTSFYALLGDASGPANFSCSGLGVSGTINSPTSNDQSINLGTVNSLGTDGTQIYNYNIGGTKKTFSLYGNNSGPTIASDLPFSWSSSADATLTADLTFYRDAGNVFAQRNLANPQTSRIYGNYTAINTGSFLELSATTGLVNLSSISTGFSPVPMSLGLNRSGTMTFTTGSRVGINNPNPQYSLDIGGDAFVSGNVYSTTPLNFINSGITGISQSGTVTNLSNTVQMGAFSFQPSPGNVIFSEMPVISGSGLSGVFQSYGLNVAGQTLITLGCANNGSSGVSGTQIILGASGQNSLINIYAGSNTNTTPSSGNLTVGVSQPIYGNTTILLGQPSGFLSVMISGIPAKIPFYY